VEAKLDACIGLGCGNPYGTCCNAEGSLVSPPCRTDNDRAFLRPYPDVEVTREALASYLALAQSRIHDDAGSIDLVHSDYAAT